MLMEQTGACDGMVDEKNKLIHDFQQVNKFESPTKYLTHAAHS